MRNNNHQREFVRKKKRKKEEKTQLKLEKRRGPKIRILCARSRYHIKITREALSFPNINAVFALREKREREGQREREFSHNYPQLSFDAGSGIYTRIFKKKICPFPLQRNHGEFIILLRNCQSGRRSEFARGAQNSVPYCKFMTSSAI